MAESAVVIPKETDPISAATSSSSSSSAPSSGLEEGWKGGSLRDSMSAVSSLEDLMNDDDLSFDQDKVSSGSSSSSAPSSSSSSSSPVASAEATTLWVNNVVGFSSEYGNPDWAANCVVGPTRVYPTYGDSPQTWAPAMNGTEEWITVAIARPLFVSKIQVYETSMPGAITKVTATLEDSSTRVVWEGPTRCGTITAAHIHTIDLEVPVKASIFRFDINQNGQEEWYEIDGIQFTGADSLVASSAASSEVKVEKKKEGTADFGKAENLSSIVSSLFKSPVGSDITFLVTIEGEKKEIPAHRCILSSRSDFFRGMETNGSLAIGSVKTVDDMPGELFVLLLEWIYTGKVTGLKAKEVVPLYMIADFYQCPKLSALCLDAFRLVLNSKNCINFYRHFSVFHLDDIRKICSEFIITNIKDVVASEAFRALPSQDMWTFFNGYLQKTKDTPRSSSSSSAPPAPPVAPPAIPSSSLFDDDDDDVGLSLFD